MDAYEEAARVVRARDRDRYVADLFAPEAARKHLLALHAFAAEIARVREVVSEPALGEIRLQWWRDALAAGDAAGHPIAAAVLETARRFTLPVTAFDMLIEARIFDLYDDPMETLNDLEGYAGQTSSALFQLAAIVLAGGQDPGSADAAGHAGVAETIVRVLRMLAEVPASAAKYVPDDLLSRRGTDRAELAARRATPATVAAIGDLRAAARHHLDAANDAIRSLPAAVVPAFLPLALVGARLRRMEGSTNPFAYRNFAPWRRQWITWRAARRGLA